MAYDEHLVWNWQGGDVCWRCWERDRETSRDMSERYAVHPKTGTPFFSMLVVFLSDCAPAVCGPHSLLVVQP